MILIINDFAKKPGIAVRYVLFQGFSSSVDTEWIETVMGIAGSVRPGGNTRFVSYRKALGNRTLWRAFFCECMNTFHNDRIIVDR